MKESKLDKLIKKLIMLYILANEDFVNLITDSMSVEYPTDEVHIKSMTSILNEVTSLSNALKNKANPMIESVIKEAYNEGYQNSNNILGDNILEQGDSQQSMLNKLVSDTCNDMLIATKYMSESAKRFVRVKTSQVMQLQQAIREGNKSLAYTLARQLEAGKLQKDVNSQAFTGIVDSMGRRWNLKTYSEMVIRTKTQQAYIYGTAEYGHKMGCHLFIISSHNAIDACKKWEGSIITVGETIDGYLSYEELAGSMEIFHPNCRHHITPISDTIAERISKK